MVQSDYSIRIDQEWSIDGQQRASDTATFSPCHMNHSGSRHNVVRSTSRRHQRVSFFTARDIQVRLNDTGGIGMQTGHTYLVNKL